MCAGPGVPPLSEQIFNQENLNWNKSFLAKTAVIEIWLMDIPPSTSVIQEHKLLASLRKLQVNMKLTSIYGKL